MLPTSIWMEKMVLALTSKDMKVYGNLQVESRILMCLKTCEKQIYITSNIHHSRMNYDGESG